MRMGRVVVVVFGGRRESLRLMAAVDAHDTAGGWVLCKTATAAVISIFSLYAVAAVAVAVPVHLI